MVELRICKKLWICELFVYILYSIIDTRIKKKKTKSEMLYEDLIEHGKHLIILWLHIITICIVHWKIVIIILNYLIVCQVVKRLAIKLVKLLVNLLPVTHPR